MADDGKKMLRGLAPLTVVRGANGVHTHVYFSQLVDPAATDRSETRRLVDEGFLEWVARDGEGWKRADDTDAGDAGESVTVASAAIADPEQDPVLGRDNGLTNGDQHRAAGTKGRSDADEDAPKRRPGRPSNAERAARDKANADKTEGEAGEKKALVDEAVKAGMDRGEAEKASVADLKAALNK